MNKTQYLQSAMTFPDCIDSFGLETGILEIVRRLIWPITILGNKLANLVSRVASERVDAIYTEDSGKAFLAFLLSKSRSKTGSQDLAHKLQH